MAQKKMDPQTMFWPHFVGYKVNHTLAFITKDCVNNIDIAIYSTEYYTTTIIYKTKSIASIYYYIITSLLVRYFIELKSQHIYINLNGHIHSNTVGYTMQDDAMST